LALPWNMRRLSDGRTWLCPTRHRTGVAVNAFLGLPGATCCPESLLAQISLDGRGQPHAIAVNRILVNVGPACDDRVSGTRRVVHPVQAKVWLFPPSLIRWMRPRKGCSDLAQIGGEQPIALGFIASDSRDAECGVPEPNVHHACRNVIVMAAGPRVVSQGLLLDFDYELGTVVQPYLDVTPPPDNGPAH
jgi:hypothetical protein